MALDGIADIQTSGDLEITKALKSAFGFNLGFAIEGRIGEDISENMNQIRMDVIGILVETIITKEGIDRKTEAGKNKIQSITNDSTRGVAQLLDNKNLQIIAQGYEKYRQSVLKGFGVKSSGADFT